MPRRVLAVLLVTGWALITAWTAHAGGKRGLEPGYASLFNGSDLTGWRYGKEPLDGKTATPDQRFTVKDGVIIAHEGKGIKDLYTTADYPKNFNLKLEFRAGLKSDSGVYIRGPQLQVRDYLRRNERPQLAGKFKNDDWNELDITVQGNVLVTTVNGKTLGPKDSLEVTVKENKPEARLNGMPVEVKDIAVKVVSIAVCNCNGEFLENMTVPATGGIGLQAETGKFEFRNIRIKELP